MSDTPLTLPADARGDARLAARRRAILLVLAEAFAFALAAAAVKGLDGRIPLAEVIVFRNLFALPALLPAMVAAGGFRALRTRSPLAHLQRGFWGLLGMGGSFYGYAKLPLPTVSALNFTMPLFLTLLSVPLLGERVGPRRAAAVVVGFAGVLLMLRPGFGSDAPDPVAAGAVLLAALGWAMAMISIRRMGENGEAGVTIVLWFALLALVVSLLAAIPVWVWPTAEQWALLFVAGAVSGVAQLLMTAAYRGGESALLAPFEYSGILWTTILGAVFWDRLPEALDFAGFAVLVGSGLYIWQREVKAKAGAAS
ncbi:DMT family transporter [Roseomonas elaeocarpi]|uniref:DMT family transporter n=1 Tax=Roseomonas elaeocarpi TaxID=907779 RepID=A0ABV6JQZ5_9PROT